MSTGRSRAHSCANLERQQLGRLKKAIIKSQNHLKSEKDAFALEVQEFEAQKQTIETQKQTIQKLKSELTKMHKSKQEMIKSYRGILQENERLRQSQLLFKMSETTQMKKLRHSKKETLNIKKRLKLALSEMDKQSKYYEQQIRKTEHTSKNSQTATPPRISLINDTSKNIDIQWNKRNELFVNVTYKHHKLPLIQKSVTSPTVKFSQEYDSENTPYTPSPSSSNRGAMSPQEAYQMFVNRMKSNANQNITQNKPKLMK